MKLKKLLAVALVGSALQFLVGCAQDPSGVELRSEGGINRLVTKGVTIHETRAPVSHIDAIARDGGLDAVVWQERQDGVERPLFAVADGSGGWNPAREARYEIELQGHSFRPESESSEPNHEGRLSIVQFKTQALDSYRDALEDSGISIINYLYHQAYLVSGSADNLEKVKDLPFVRWVGEFKPEYKISRDTLDTFAMNDGPAKILVVPTNPEALATVVAAIQEAGRPVFRASALGMIVETELDIEQVAVLAREDSVAWIQPLTEASDDMEHARIQGGANFLSELPESAPAGYTGVGIRGHIMEGIDASHPDFASNQYREKPIAIEAPASTTHGQSTFGIIFGSGSGNPKAKGILPNGQGYYTNYDFVMNGSPESRDRGTRHELVGRLMREQKILFQTASWGYARTLEYDARSAEMDRLIFDNDLPITQSQSNACNRDSRPQAWAKNVISVGAIYHYNNADPADDKWKGNEFSCASIGPAKDGRIKPDLVAYYDDTLTTGMGTSYTVFGGTSGATPIVAGYLGLSLELYTNGVFATLAHPLDQRFENRPHFTTSKALMINTANQYAFQGATHDLTRVHQGWGFPSVKNMYEKAPKILVVDESFLLKNLESKAFEVVVDPSEAELKVTMTYADPVGNLANQKNRVNDLDLKVTAPDGTIYLGNVGLLENNYSTPGGTADRTDTVENVFIQGPMAGTWTVEVTAQELVTDGRPSTPELDSAFALIMNGVKK